MRFLHHIQCHLVNRGLPRLVYVTTADHAYTFASLVRPLYDRGIRLSGLSWERLFRLRRAPAAAWVLTDFDRLSPVELEAATLIARRLMAAGHPVLNDPGQFRPRHALLGALRAAGVNRTAVWWPAAGEWPDRFPVILRTIAAHRGPLGDLLPDTDHARAGLAAALAHGLPLADLVFVAFDAAPTADGLWQKHAAFRIGPAIVRANTVNAPTWAAKSGQRGLAPPAVYAAELAEMADYPHAATVRAVFDAAGLTYGRLDFGLVEGRLATYEINTNPFISTEAAHPDPARRQTLLAMADGLVGALAAHARAAPPGRPAPLHDITPRTGHGPWRRLRRW
jgi:hypothetical protein